MKKPRTAKSLRAHGSRRPNGKAVFAGNEKHLQLLKESLRRRSFRFWNRWRERHPRVVPDLRGLILVGRFLGGFNLARAQLDRAFSGGPTLPEHISSAPV